MLISVIASVAEMNLSGSRYVVDMCFVVVVVINVSVSVLSAIGILVEYVVLLSGPQVNFRLFPIESLTSVNEKHFNTIQMDG